MNKNIWPGRIAMLPIMAISKKKGLHRVVAAGLGSESRHGLPLAPPLLQSRLTEIGNPYYLGP